MSKMVERLVLAIHEGLGGNGWAYINYGGDELNSCRAELESAALAVLTALREPTQGMLEAGILANDKYATEIAPCSGFRTSDAWEAMIDAALSNSKGGEG